MIDARQLKFGVTYLLAALSAQVAMVHADEGDALNFTVSQSFYRDNNLYRLADGAAAPEGKRGDTISTTRADIRFDRTYSRQRLQADLTASKAMYRTHSNLDYTAPDLRLAWDWRLGNRWSGELGYSYNEALAGFEDTRGTSQVIRRLARANASIDYWLHPDWALGVGMAQVNSDYRDDARPESTYDTREADLNLTYRPSSGNRVVFSLRSTEGHFPNRAAVTGSLRDYRQSDMRLTGEWRLTGATRLTGYVGHTQRKYDLASNRDFSGVTGRVALQWAPTAKTLIDLAWRREIGADQDLVSNYAVTEALSLNPVWSVSDKIRLGASFEYRKRDYGGDPELGLEGLVSTRDDRTRSYGLNLQYLPDRALSLGFGVRRQQRDSEVAARAYKAQTVWLSGNFTF